MIPLIISGVFLAGLLLGEKFSKASDPWNNREEEQNFQKECEKWRNEGWMLYR